MSTTKIAIIMGIDITALFRLEFVFYTNVSRLLRPSVKGCKTWIWFEAISGHVLIMAVEILLMMRSKFLIDMEE